MGVPQNHPSHWAIVIVIKKNNHGTLEPWGSPSQINRYAGHCFTGREQQPREFRREFQRWESESAEFRARVRQVLPI